MDAKTVRDLQTKLIGKKIYFYREIGSTNDEAKRLLKMGLGEGVVVIAEGQTSGREWASPQGKGVYVSIIIQPFRASDKNLEITLLGALAAARAINGLTGLSSKVKWPNDVVVSGKKIGGVLTEMAGGTAKARAIVVGIGINITTSPGDVPEDIRERTTSVLLETGKKISRTVFTRTLLEEFEKLYFLLLAGEGSSIIDEWMILSDTIGRDIRIKVRGEVREGRAMGVGKQGELIIKKFGGRIFTVNSGEILSQRSGYNAS